MPKKFTYADSGVDREARTKAKTALKILKETFRFSRYGDIVTLPYGYVFPLGERYLHLEIETVGTKVLVAQLADKYDTIGLDGVAMAVNDVIRSGATPIAIADNIHDQVSDPALIRELMKGIAKGAEESECLVPSGEIGDLAGVITGIVEGKGFDLVVSCVGELTKDKMIQGNSIKSGDVVIGLRSAGVHSNGITLARKVLFKQWGGKYDPFVVLDGFDRELVYEVLEPTKIYVKPLNVAKKVQIKGAVHITGDAYLKFNRLMKFSEAIGFEFNNFKPQPVFGLIQRTARETKGKISDEEMLKTFNMGWGFAVVVEKSDIDATIDYIEKAGVEAEQIGNVTKSGEILAHYRNKKILLQ